MKRSFVFLVTLLLILLSFIPQALSQSSAAGLPVLVFVRMRATDAINIGMTENRLRRSLQMLEALKKQYPSTPVKATIYVNGAVSEVLAQRNPQTGVRDLLLNSAKAGLVEIGYDGTNEPRSSEQPLVDYRNVNTPKEDYLARQAVAERVLGEGRDPITGKLVPDADGGLKKMQQVFGEAASIWGAQVQVKDVATGTMPDWGSDAEMVQQIGLMNSRGTLPGVLEDVPHFDFFYDDWIPAYSKNLSATADTSPEVYWQENRLRISERSDKSSKVVNAWDGPDGLKDYLEKLNRAKIRIVVLEIGGEKGYLRPAYRDELIYPPFKYAEKHPGAPRLPEEAFAKEEDVAASFQKEKDALGYVLDSFLSRNKGSRLVASRDLVNMTSPCVGYRVGMASLLQALADLDRSWGDATSLPKYVQVDSRYLSLAQTFQVVADSLVERRRTGKRPESVEVLNVYGPIDMPSGTGAIQTEVTAKDVALAAVYIVPPLHEQIWSPLPRNAVPGQVQVDKVTVNGAQYLRLMIEALLLEDPQAKLTVRPTGMIWAPEAVAFRTRPVAEMGTIWTIKPAPLNLAQTVNASN